MNDAFLSYSGRKAHTEHLCAVLRAYGFDAWWDENLHVGPRYDEQIEQRLVAASSVIVLWCSHSISSRWARDEAEVGIRYGKLLAARLERVDAPIGMRTAQTADLIDWTGVPDAPGILRLVEGMERLTKRSRRVSNTLMKALSSFEHLKPITPGGTSTSNATGVHQSPQELPSETDCGIDQMRSTTTDHPRILVMDFEAVSKFRSFALPPDWMQSFQLSPQATGVKRVLVNDICYLLRDQGEHEPERVLVFDLGPEAGIRDHGSPYFETLFYRAWSIAMAFWTHSKQVPVGWQKYRAPNQARLSIYPAARSQSGKARLYLRECDEAPQWMVAHALTDIKDFEAAYDDRNVVKRARDNLLAAVLSPGVQQSSVGHDLVLAHAIDHSFDMSLTIEDWYRSKLTATQRTFVDQDYSRHVRLRGAAGTGKTLAMVIKCVRDATRMCREGKPWRVAYLTHSQAAREHVESILNVLDEEGLSSGTATDARIDVVTIYELAAAFLRIAEQGRHPLSTDGVDGRLQQRDYIRIAVLDSLKEEWFTTLLGSASEKLGRDLRAAETDEDAYGLHEIMNEFACKLDGEGIRFGTDAVARYLTENRPNWLMRLPKKEDRQVVLEIYRKYWELLKTFKILSIDQLAADLSRTLDQHVWQQARLEEGYDALFVDEAHMFSDVERMTLHKLLRQETYPERQGKPIFLAHDLKQATTNKFTQIVSRQSTRLWGNSELEGAAVVNLKEIFRYTPQITHLIRSIDAQFPLLNMGEDWAAFDATSQVADGPMPTFSLHLGFEEMVRENFQAAVEVAARSSGRHVAVLLISDKLLDQACFLAQSIVGNRFVECKERVNAGTIRYLGKRFLLSAPEYVAGLQFDTVFLLGINKDTFAGESSPIRQRETLSSLYLGASRAEKRLHVAASREQGGLADVLAPACANGLLVEAAPNSLTR